jgi:hypothetical protein
VRIGENKVRIALDDAGEGLVRGRGGELAPELRGGGHGAVAAGTAQLAAADLTAAAACSVSAGGADRQLAVHGSQSAVLLLCHG